MSRRTAITIQLCLGLALTAALGCGGQSGGAGNPFAIADRVPAPQTRMPAPGTAVPNYMTGPPASFGTPAVPVSSPGVLPNPSFGPQTTTPIARNTLADSGSTVGIPTDTGSLRFDSPPPMLARQQPLVELAARDLPPGTNLGGSTPPSTSQPAPVNPYAAAATPRLRFSDSGNLNSVPVVPAASEPSTMIRQRPAIMELPPSRAGTVAPVVDQTADGFRPRSAARDTFVPAQPTSPSGMSASGATGGYGYGPSYAQLRGRLEFNPAIGYWKLRYIPIDGASDEFGGTVAIGNPERLAGMQPGDWVTIAGQLQATPTSNGSYTAVYMASEVTRQ